jgi:hypothetical protein
MNAEAFKETMGPVVWRVVETSEPHFALWWFFCWCSAWLLTKEPGYYAEKLHSLVNYRIFLQGIRQKNQDSGMISWGWTLLGFGTLGLILMGSTNVHILSAFGIRGIPSGFALFPLGVMLWILVLGIAMNLWSWWLRLWGWVTDFSEGFRWVKATVQLSFHVLIPIILLLALVIRYGTPHWITSAYVLSGGLMAMTLGFRWVRIFRLSKEDSLNHLLLMIFYICTFEIIPILGIAMKLRHG